MSRVARLSAVVALVTGLSLFGCAEELEPTPGPLTSFIALTRDFEGFTSFPRFAVAGEAIPDGAEPGPTFVYANALPPEGARRFPIGTILVKTIEPEGAPPTSWTIHAMVKRDETFNPVGAVGWEYFELALTEAGEPVILWRGEGPPSGHGYGSIGVPDPTAIPLVCNDCHAAAWINDSVLTPALTLSTGS